MMSCHWNVFRFGIFLFCFLFFICVSIQRNHYLILLLPPNLCHCLSALPPPAGWKCWPMVIISSVWSEQLVERKAAIKVIFKSEWSCYFEYCFQIRALMTAFWAVLMVVNFCLSWAILISVCCLTDFLRSYMQTEKIESDPTVDDWP